MDAQKAVVALVSASRKDKSLEGPIFVQIILPEPAVKDRQQHPVLLPMPHRFRRRDETMTCLVVRDPASQISQELNQDPNSAMMFDEIIGVGKLRRRLNGGKKTGKTTKATEQFTKTFPLIFVHEKVREPLSECLGIGFYKRAKHLPIPVSYVSGNEKSKEQLKFVAKAALQSAQLILRPEGKSTSVRIGHTKMDTKKLVENVEAAIKLCKQRIPNGLGGASVYYIKTPDSLSIQIA